MPGKQEPFCFPASAWVTSEAGLQGSPLPLQLQLVSSPAHSHSLSISLHPVTPSLPPPLLKIMELSDSKATTQEASPGPGASPIQIQLLYTAANAKSRQSRPTLCNPIDSSSPGSPVPGILKATLEWVAISFSNA